MNILFERKAVLSSLECLYAVVHDLDRHSTSFARLRRLPRSLGSRV